MYIKSIAISNFRSFRQQPEIQPFSSGTNSVVGRNGSGKSNLFDAVQFVLLAPRFANLRQEERQALLHEGSGSAAINAFVEIVFDNSDHRFSLENSDEVVLRRTIGLKKDEFFLQRKRATKNEVQSLLEGAGFSKSNPYFIVQQGKVQDLCTMSDSERLLLLKEVAGTTVYDDKKAESMAKMEENKDSVAKIQEILSGIEERIEELESEKEELTNYQKFDRQRKALEYTLYDKELRKARNILDALEYERQEHVEHLSKLSEQARETHEAIRNVEGEMNSKVNALRRNRNALQSLEEDGKNSVTHCTKLELECKELEEAVRSGEEQYKANQKELQVVEKEIAEANRKIALVEPEYEQAVAALQQMTDRRDQAKSQMEALYDKQGRGRQFASAEERDEHLKENIADLEQACAEKENTLIEQRDSRLANLRRSIQTETKEIQEQTQRLQQKSNTLQGMSKEIEEKKRERLEAYDTRKEDWRKTEELREQVREARDNYSRASAEMRKVMPRNTAMGLEALKTIVEQERLTPDQYFGTVMENFELKNERFQTAVEVAAQNSLFHVIVDTDDTAAKLMHRLESGKLGRVTFLPLDKLRVDQGTTSELPDSPDIRSMIDLCIKFDGKVERAMRHVFSKKLVARTAELAAEWSTRLGMDAITLDGDLCSRKGSLTGGYIDTNKSRLRAHAKKEETQKALRRLEREHRHMTQKSHQIDQSVTNLMAELQRLEARHAEITHKATEDETELERVQSRLENHKKQAEELEKTSIPALERAVAALKADIGRLKDELGTELTQTLSEKDQKLMDELKKVQTDLVTEIEAQNEKVSRVGVERQKLRSLLDDNLLKRRQELTEGISVLDEGEGGKLTSVSAGRRSSIMRLSSKAVQAQRKEDLQDRRRQLDDAIRIRADVEGRIEACRQAEEQIRSELYASKNELEQLKSQDMKNAKALEEAQEKSERFFNKRSMSISKRETYMRKIQELGSLPPPAELDKVSGKSISDLMKALEGVNKKLKKYSHINKKAYDQYVNFADQREALIKRKEELDRGAEKIQEMIDSLDRQKDEAINRTFRGVSAHFKDVFKELVPNGGGELIMRTALDEENETDEEAESDDDARPKKKPIDRNNPDVSLYRGVGIKIRFSEVGENYMMSQLSGGQKALVAMALIFSIQRCDPAPFYLFDELDQALDSTYRAAVAGLIERQARSKDSPTQFIVSTFRPELVSVANRCYGISHQNKVSSLHQLSKSDALGFVANLMNEEEAVGEVTTVATSKFSRMSFSREGRKRKAADQTEEEFGSPGAADESTDMTP